VTCVLDASALLALLHGEPGAERVEAVLEGALMCTVNWSEVMQKSIARGADVEGMGGELEEAGLRFEGFTEQQAELAGRLWPDTKHVGLALADRACLALALDKSLPVMTADRAWETLEIGVNIDLIR
jgi:PIN domain nuclease of toxin-antitoxin system